MNKRTMKSDNVPPLDAGPKREPVLRGLATRGCYATALSFSYSNEQLFNELRSRGFVVSEVYDPTTGVLDHLKVSTCGPSNGQNWVPY